MAYEKALSLISGGGKTFEMVGDLIKATPEEMEVGAVITFADGEDNYAANFVSFKGNDPSDGRQIIQTIGLDGDGTVSANTYIYNEAEGGYRVKGR